MMKFFQKQRAHFLSYNLDIFTKIYQTLTEYILRLNKVYQRRRILGRIVSFGNLERRTLNRDLQEDYENDQFN